MALSLEKPQSATPQTTRSSYLWQFCHVLNRLDPTLSPWKFAAPTLSLDNEHPGRKPSRFMIVEHDSLLLGGCRKENAEYKNPGLEQTSREATILLARLRAPSSGEDNQVG